MRCPSCGNYVIGNIKRSTGSKLTRNLVKKGGMKAIGFAAGSIVPGVGNAVGFAAGALADCLMGEEINKGVDELVDTLVVTDDTYEFVCPKCGKKWTKKFSAAGSSFSQSYSSSYPTSQGSSFSYTSGASRGTTADDFQLLKLICQYAKNKPGNVSATIGAAGIKWKGLVSRLNSDYGLHIYEHQLPHSGQIKDLIKMIQVLAGGGSCSASQTTSQSTSRDSFDVENNAFYTGLGPNVDYEKAYTFAVKGAELGDEAAMETLGQLYEHGKGVTQNLQTALEWYQKAADLGNEDAQKRLKELALTKIIDGLIASKLAGSIITDAKRTDGLSEAEQEYLDELKACLEDDAEISLRERRLLERLRTNLGISEARATELEASLSQPVLTEAEKEYLSEYQECATDGIISDKERRLLDKLRNVLGISEERAKKLESIELNNRINY